MAAGTGVTEIADSEEELLTSSPAAVSDAAVDKLSATAGQDVQAVACPHQELAEHLANQISSRTGLLGADQDKPSTDVETTHNDHPDLQATHQMNTNNASACATETLLNTGVSLDAAGEDHQASCSGTNRGGGEISNLRDTGTLPRTNLAGEPDKRALLPINDQIHVSELQNDDQQPQLQVHPPTILEGNDVLHVSFSKERSQDEAVGSHIVTLKPSYSDPVQLASIEQEAILHDNACDIPQKNLGATESKALAGEPSHNTSQEATISSHNPTAVYHPDVTVNPGQTASGTANVPDLMDLDALQRAPDLTLSYAANSDQSETAAKLSASQKGCFLAAGVEPQHVTTPAAASSAPLPGAELTTRRNDHEASDEESSVLDLAASSKTTGGHDLRNEQGQRNHIIHETTTDTATSCEILSTQASTIASNEQDREEVRPTKSEQVAAEQLPVIPTQSPTNTVQSHCGHDPVVGDDQNLAFKAPEIQTKSQSTVSQASEPTSPRPAAKLSPQEITLAELRAQKAALLGSLKVLPAIQVLIEENCVFDADMSDNDDEPTEAEVVAAANKIVKEHIKLLHEYNELKDIGQGLMGLIADQRGVRIVEVQDEFGIDAND